MHGLITINDGEECPSDDFKQGIANGQCWGDGHYRCGECIHYRPDFKANGSEYIDWVYRQQGGLTINGMNILTH